MYSSSSPKNAKSLQATLMSAFSWDRGRLARIEPGSAGIAGSPSGSPLGSAMLPAMSAVRREQADTQVRPYNFRPWCFLLKTGIIIIRRNFIQLTHQWVLMQFEAGSSEFSL
jgi:hypothetical protein